MKFNVMIVMTDLITVMTVIVMTRRLAFKTLLHDGRSLATWQALGRAPKDLRGLGTPEPSQQGCKDCLSPQGPLLEDSS
jgi:hypothetical protein